MGEGRKAEGHGRAREASGVRQTALDPVSAAAIEELNSGAVLADAGLVEALADHAHALAASGSSEDLCAAMGCQLHADASLSGHEGLLLQTGVILVRPRRDAARVRLVVLHELAHWIFGENRIAHTHADVWALALALGAPRSVALRYSVPGDLAAATGLPWVIAHRRLVMVGAD